MGCVRVKGVVANPFRREFREEVEFVVADTGAIYTTIPRRIAEKLNSK